MYIQWDEKFSVNIRQFDAQHQRLFELVNNLHRGMKEGNKRDALQATLDGLIAYTITHFGAEEQMMLKHGYPGFDTHHKEHDDLLSQVREFKVNFDAGKSMLTVEVMGFLVNWLTHHIAGTDKKYSAYLNGKGVA